MDIFLNFIQGKMPEIFFFLVIFFSAIIHEYAHAWMADYLGDPTPRSAGRLTLNPIPHIDLFGSILVPLFLLIYQAGFIIGWAKPVSFNPYNLRGKKYGTSLVAVAGPLINIFLALVFGLTVRFFPISIFTSFLAVVVYSNILLAVFNLIPIPPLDGSNILFDLLPASFNKWKLLIMKYRFIIFLFFVFFASNFISPVVFALFKIITGHPLVSFL